MNSCVISEPSTEIKNIKDLKILKYKKESY